MGNHVHLLIKPTEEDLALIFKRIGGRYVYWYNAKYQRVGHLFQGRFKSEPVEDDGYFLTVLRYIHQNPTKAGLCKDISEYTYSSYREYIDGRTLLDRDLLFGMISREEFIRYSNDTTSEKCLDVAETNTLRVTDEQAREIIYKHSKCKSVADFQDLSNERKAKIIPQLNKSGVSIRQIVRLTGVRKSVVERLCRV